MTPPLAVTLAALEVYRHLQICAPTAKDRVEPPDGAPREHREKWEARKLLEQHPPEELPIPPQDATEHVKAAFALNKAIRQMAFHHALVLADADSCRTLCQYFCPCIQKMST